jgi:hypothetical protein
LDGGSDLHFICGCKIDAVHSTELSRRRRHLRVPVEAGAGVLLGDHDDLLSLLDGVVDLGNAVRPEEHA